MAADSSSMPAACPIPAAKNNSARSPAATPPSSTISIASQSVHEFLAHATSLVDASVANYRQRGFSSLMVSFGCTGGQHRSVYLAEQLAKHLRGTAGVEVVLRHTQLEKLGMLAEPVQ